MKWSIIQLFLLTDAFLASVHPQDCLLKIKITLNSLVDGWDPKRSAYKKNWMMLNLLFLLDIIQFNFNSITVTIQ